MTTWRSTWTGRVPVEDTALAVTDTGGRGVPLVYLNGQFATQSSWRRVVADLGEDYRHITYDERARGKSSPSKDYSFQAGVRDVDAVLEARRVERPVVLVGWSYGAAIAVRWASEHPQRVLGIVSVDGAYPFDYTDQASLARIRKQFQRLRWITPLLRALGLTARMSADEQAESTVELLRVVATLGPLLEAMTVPVQYVVASGGNLGGGAAEMERMRASLKPVLAHNPHVRSVKVASNHAKILRKDFRAVADAVREVAADRHEPTWP